MTQDTPAKPAPPKVSLTFDDSVSEWNFTGPEWLKRNEKTWHAIAVGAIIFDSQDRMLLVQRASHDSLPNLWEVPGGAVDPEDPSILYGCARELWEESGLVARHISNIVTEGPGLKPGTVFPNRTGKRFFCKFTFVVEVEEGEVKLDPEEHQDYVWATEEEARSGSIGERKIPITHAQMSRLVLEAFRLRKLNKGKEAATPS
ncbi:Fc.00g002350.m01.CDS01 [Cosmosporella sp. VM-42]